MGTFMALYLGYQRIFLYLPVAGKLNMHQRSYKSFAVCKIKIPIQQMSECLHSILLHSGQQGSWRFRVWPICPAGPGQVVWMSSSERSIIFHLYPLLNFLFKVIKIKCLLS